MKLVKICLFIVATILLYKSITENDLDEGYGNLFLSLITYILAFGLERI